MGIEFLHPSQIPNLQVKMISIETYLRINGISWIGPKHCRDFFVVERQLKTISAKKFKVTISKI